MWLVFHPGIVVGAWPCGKIAMINELFGAESKAQVYGSIHSFLYENPSATKELRTYMYVHDCLQSIPLTLSLGYLYFQAICVTMMPAI